MPLTKSQWMNICLEGYGLRSATSDNDLKGASYALDDGVRFQFGGAPPDDWDKKLEGTLSQMLGFSNSSGRVLLLVKGVHGTSADYGGCFQKCSSHAQSVKASTDLSAQSAETLAEWILKAIS